MIAWMYAKFPKPATLSDLKKSDNTSSEVNEPMNKYKCSNNRRISNYEDSEVLDLLSETFTFAMYNRTNNIRRNELYNGWRKLGYVHAMDVIAFHLKKQ